MSRVEQTCGDHDPSLPLPSPSSGMAVAGLAELLPILVQEGYLRLIARVGKSLLAEQLLLVIVIWFIIVNQDWRKRCYYNLLQTRVDIMRSGISIGTG